MRSLPICIDQSERSPIQLEGEVVTYLKLRPIPDYDFRRDGSCDRYGPGASLVIADSLLDKESLQEEAEDHGESPLLIPHPPSSQPEEGLVSIHH